MNERRRLVGFVKSNKMMKTVVVEINRTYRHPFYKKVVHSSRRVKAHDELGCQEGDRVQIVESRPLSRDKRWVVEAIIKRGQGLEAERIEEEIEKSALEVDQIDEEVEQNAVELDQSDAEADQDVVGE